MSGASDNVFARWSRRKLTVRDGEGPEPASEAPAKAEAGPDAPQDAVAEPETATPAMPLPRLEDITAESDLSTFLRKGVPEELKRAALRKSWSLDQAIRDYIGPSENAWDFNAPGSMIGFGPLDAGKAVADFLSTMSTSESPRPTKAAAPYAHPASPEESPALPGAAAKTDDASGEAPPDAPAAPQTAANSPVVPTDHAQAAAETDGERQPDRFVARPRHGGAIPR